ncbi:MAG: ketoacyl-ACP synthase III [Chitinophagaceae bacterium]|nr:ketoacyl-ACP synthase III [Chitinophagaceae bacterium]
MPVDPATISAVAYYLPNRELTNEQLSIEFPEWSVEKIMAKVGIASRRIAAPDEFVSDLAVKASQKLFEEHNISAADIDYLVVCTQSPDYFLPATSCIVHHRLGLPANAGAIDVNQGCSGFVYGLGLAKGIITSGDACNILLITADTYSRFLHPLDKGNRSIFGDAAAATLVSSKGAGAIIGKMIWGTDGRGAHNLIVKNGAMRSPRSGDTHLYTDEDGNAYNDNYLFMNGSEVFNFTLEAVPALISRILEKNNLKQEEIDLFVFHQANRFILDYLRKKTKIPADKFFIWMETCGNTVSSTIPIALYQAQKSNSIKKGDKVLVAGFGVGYSWGGTVLYF